MSIKIDVISGFLGAGKTTLIKKLFKNGFNNEKVVLIENEFGEIGIDGSFLKESGVDIKEINSGAYWFKVKDLTDYLGKITNNTSQNEYYLTSVIKLFIDDGLRVDAFETSSSDVALGANDTCQLQRLNEVARNKVIEGLLESGIKIPCRDGVIVGKWVKVGSGTTILPGTVLSGNTTIGKECTIGPNSQIIDCVIGDNTVINHSYCKKSEVSENKEIGPFASLVNINDLLTTDC